MGTKTQTIQFDDLDGESTATQLGVRFTGPNGAEFEIDLTDDHAEQLDQVVAAYAEARAQVEKDFAEDIADFESKARPVAAKTSRRGASAKRPARVAMRKVSAGRGNGAEQNAVIRDWAKRQGLPVSERGRLSEAVTSAFEAAHAALSEPAAAVTAPVTRRGRAG